MRVALRISASVKVTVSMVLIKSDNLVDSIFTRLVILLDSLLSSMNKLCLTLFISLAIISNSLFRCFSMSWLSCFNCFISWFWSVIVFISSWLNSCCSFNCSSMRVSVSEGVSSFVFRLNMLIFYHLKFVFFLWVKKFIIVLYIFFLNYNLIYNSNNI